MCPSFDSITKSYFLLFDAKWGGRGPGAATWGFIAPFKLVANSLNCATTLARPILTIKNFLTFPEHLLDIKKICAGVLNSP